FPQDVLRWHRERAFCRWWPSVLRNPVAQSIGCREGAWAACETSDSAIDDELKAEILAVDPVGSPRLGAMSSIGSGERLASSAVQEPRHGAPASLSDPRREGPQVTRSCDWGLASA